LPQNKHDFQSKQRIFQTAAELPEAIQKQAELAFEHFVENPQHPGLQFKKIRGHKNLYSARVDLNYRVMGNKTGTDTIVWFWIGTHAEYERLLGL